MIVVSDKTPLRYLALLLRVNFLHRLFKDVHCLDLGPRKKFPRFAVAGFRSVSLAARIAGQAVERL